MKRRNFISNIALSATTATVVSACQQSIDAPNVQADSLPNIQWNMVTSWPTSLDTIYGGALTISERVEAMTGGKFKIKPYAAGEIVPGLEVLDAVQNGTAQCGHSASYYYIGKNPSLAFATTMPFGLTAQQQNAWLYHGGGLEMMQKVYSDFNIINFPAGNTGAQMGGWFKREISTLNDLKGLKMRIPGLGGKVMAKLGVNVQVLPGGEIFFALDRGAIDAAEFSGPYDDEKLGLNKAANFYYYPGWWEPGPTLDFLVNKSEWDKLPQQYQEILISAAKEANVNMLSKYEVLNKQSLKTLVDGGTQLKAYSQEILKEAQKASTQILEDTAKDDATFKEIYDQWSKFREEITQWNKINELSYNDFVSR